MVHRPGFVDLVERSQLDAGLPETHFRQKLCVRVPGMETTKNRNALFVRGKDRLLTNLPVILTTDCVNEGIYDRRHPRKHASKHVQICVGTVVVDYVRQHQRHEANQEAKIDRQQRHRKPTVLLVPEKGLDPARTAGTVE